MRNSGVVERGVCSPMLWNVILEYLTKDAESALLLCTMPLTMKRSRASFLTSRRHILVSGATGRIGNELDPAVGTKLNDQEEVHNA